AMAVKLAEVAIKDYEASKTLLEKGLYPQAAFMLQQSLEKAIKAILLRLGLTKAEELRRRIGHAIIRNSLELIIHRIS
ncbi:MAG: HEPN domain-containing protein, partial [Pyrodictiaceae archaeon]